MEAVAHGVVMPTWSIETYVQGRCFEERAMVLRDPAADVFTCRSQRPDGVDIERMYDDVVACTGLEPKNREVEVVEDFDSRPHKPVKFEGRCKKVPQKGKC